MMGTLAAELAGKKIRTHKELYRAEVRGDIEDVGGILKITRISVDYNLKVPDDKKAEAREAFESYLSKCPAAQSVIGCIKLEHSLVLG
jgi:organic hydroperoxide reductase OsmC/OhrA